MPLAEEEYWRIFDLIRGDVEAAIKSHHTYLTINNLVLADPLIFQKLNRFADFWTLNAFALQTTFFVTFGRLFDTRSDSHSIHKLIKATIDNSRLFSKAALLERKRRLSRITGIDPQWLVDLIADAWEPTTADLESLRSALTPHCDKFKAIYKPLRHKVFAHKGMEDATVITGLFTKALFPDIDAILRFLHTLLYSITEMRWNATRPNLSDLSSYERWVNEINHKTEQFIRQLP